MDRPAIEVNEAGNNWDHLGSPTFLKNYLANDICVCFKMRSRFAKADSEDHYAVFSKFLGARVPHANNFGRLIRFAHLGRDIFINTNCDFLAQLSDGCGDDQHPVFINDVIFMKGGENSIVRSRSRVGLYRPDEFFCGATDAPYQSAVTGLFEFFSRGADGELIVVGGRPAVFNDQGVQQVVQAGSEVVNNLACENAETSRNGGVAERYKSILSPIVLVLSDNLIRFGIATEESRDFSIEIVDVFFGSLNFGPTAL